MKQISALDPRTAHLRRLGLGFTLTELLVTVAIVGILAAIAYPSYRAQVQTTRRAEVQATLSELTQYLERVYSEYGCYNPGPNDSTKSCDDVKDAVAPPLPELDDDDYYTIGYTDGEPTQTTFKLIANPVQGKSQEGNGALTVDQAGRQEWDENGNGDFTDAGEDDWHRG